jgi:predicted PurR-regulated permease PerM
MIKPLLVAGLLAYSLHLIIKPLVDNTRLSHKAAVNIIYIVLILLLIATPSTLIPIAVSQAETISAELVLVEANIREFLLNPVLIFGREIMLNEVVANVFDLTGENLIADPESALNVLETTSISLIRLLVIFVTTYYLLVDYEGLLTWLVNRSENRVRVFYFIASGRSGCPPNAHHWGLADLFVRCTGCAFCNEQCHRDRAYVALHF